MTNGKSKAISFSLIFSVGSVLFSAHAGGGFATGNQANTYYVGLGWLAPVSAILAVLLMILTMREAMFMYNSRGFKSHKELFQALFQPYPKLSWLFEIFFYIMVLMAVSAAISGAATALEAYFGINYILSVLITGTVVLILTIFGAGLVRTASTYMGIAILVSAISIYVIGIFKGNRIDSVLAENFNETGFSSIFKTIQQAFIYAGFQCVTLPTMLACGTPLTNKKSCNRAMNLSFVMNAIALTLSVLMLLSWQETYTSDDAGKALPTLTVCNEMNMPWLMIAYGICLIMCLISTGVTTTFGFVARFEKLPFLQKIESSSLRNAAISGFIIIISMTISMVGLTNIIKYGYGWCGYLGIAVVILPILTIGIKKNRQFIRENPEYKG